MSEQPNTSNLKDFPTGYTPVKKLGEGAIAKVIQATDNKTGKKVAVKILKDVDDPDDVARLGVEIESISRVRHPNIVTFLTHGKTEDGAPFVVMEWLEGINLRDVMLEDDENQRLSVPYVLEITLQILNALNACHKKGVVHRDIKPENIMLLGENKNFVKLIDFGMAKLLYEGYDLTVEGQLFGTPQYLAPERITGAPSTSASDIYSLGIMMYEMLSGERPFDGDNPQEILVQHLSKKPPSLAALTGNPDDTKLSNIIKRMMRQNPMQRPSAQTLLQELRIYRKNYLEQKIHQ